MAIGTEVVAIRYEDIVAGVPISVPIPVFQALDVQIFYGIASLQAVLNEDYTIALGDDFNTFSWTPTQALIDKIDALIALDPDEENAVTVRRHLNFLTEATAAAVRYTPFTAYEFDRTVMRFQQIEERINRALVLAPTFVGDNPLLQLNALEPGASLKVSDDGTAIEPGPQIPNIDEQFERAKEQADRAEREADYAEEWARSPDPISVEAGGDGVNDRSSKTYAERSEASALSAAISSAVASAASGRLDIASFEQLATKFVYADPDENQQVAAVGDVILWREKGFAYKVVSSDAVGNYLDYTGSGGIKVRYVPTGGRCFPEALGAVRDDTTDVSALVQLANDIAEETGTILESEASDGGYYLDGSVTFTVDTDIRCRISTPADGVARYLDIGLETTYDTLDFASLGGLNVFSDKITGLPADAYGRYLEIISDEVLTERITGGETPYYNKLSAVYIMGTDGHITPSLDMTFNAGHTVSVRLMHKEPRRLKVRFAEIHCVDTSGELLTAVRINRDDTDLEIGKLSSEGAQFRTSVNLYANGCTFKNSGVDDSQYTGLGYGISIGLSCNTLIDGLTGGSNRHAVSGRHGSNVTVQNSILQSCDTHWSNDFRVYNCKLGYVAFSGKDLDVQRCAFSRDSYAILNRSDISYAIGNFTAKDIILEDGVVSLLYGDENIPTANKGLFTTPRRMFDNINIENIDVRQTGSFRLISDLYAGADTTTGDVEYAPARVVNIDKVFAKHASTFWALYGPTSGVWPVLGFVRHIDISDVYTEGRHEFVRLNSVNPNNNGFILRIDNCGQIDPWVTNSAVERMEVIDCDVSIRGSNSGTARGGIFIRGGKFQNHSLTEPNNPVVVHNAEWMTNSSMQYTVAARKGCLVPAGGQAAWAADYVNPTYYAT